MAPSDPGLNVKLAQAQRSRELLAFRKCGTVGHVNNDMHVNGLVGMFQFSRVETKPSSPTGEARDGYS